MMQGSRYFDPPPEDEEIRLLSLHDSQLRTPQFRSLGLTSRAAVSEGSSLCPVLLYP